MLLLGFTDSAQDNGKIARRKSVSEDADQAFDGREQPTWSCQHDVAVANSWMSDTGKVEGKRGIAEASLHQ